ncbi:davT [Scenedesmus sp. PABB004]|nr:davT [Scenedesmus sp. PABB004]
MAPPEGDEALSGDALAAVAAATNAYEGEERGARFGHAAALPAQQPAAKAAAVSIDDLTLGMPARTAPAPAGAARREAAPGAAAAGLTPLPSSGSDAPGAFTGGPTAAPQHAAWQADSPTHAHAADGTFVASRGAPGALDRAVLASLNEVLALHQSAASAAGRRRLLNTYEGDTVPAEELADAAAGRAAASAAGGWERGSAPQRRPAAEPGPAALGADAAADEGAVDYGEDDAPSGEPAAGARFAETAFDLTPAAAAEAAAQVAELAAALAARLAPRAAEQALEPDAGALPGSNVGSEPPAAAASAKPGGNRRLMAAALAPAAAIAPAAEGLTLLGGEGGRGDRPMWGVTYSWRRAEGCDGARSVCRCPHPDELEDDLAHLHRYAHRVRTFALECPELLAMLAHHVTADPRASWLLGLWFGRNAAANKEQVRALSRLLREHPGASIAGIAVGSEAVSRGDATPAELAAAVGEVRTLVRAAAAAPGGAALARVPVLAVEAPEAFTPELVAAVDVVGLALAPFYAAPVDTAREGWADRAAAAAVQQAAALAAAHPGKQVLVAEVGWPSASGELDTNRGGADEAAAFARAWTQAAEAAGLPYYYHELADAGWKAAASSAGSSSHVPGALAKFNDIVVAKGLGSWVWDTAGNKYLDMTCGIGVTSTGHCHPAVVAAVREQAGTIVHAQQNIFAGHTKQVELDGHLSRIMPPRLTKYFYCNSGSEAVDNAVKIARAATGRQAVIAFDGGFHGRTLGAMALTSSKVVYRQHFGPLMPGVHIAPYPYCLHCKVQVEKGHSGYHVAPYCQPFDDPANRVCCNAPLEALEWMLAQQVHPGDVAALIIEPVLGEGGFLTPPPGFLAGLRRLADAHGMLLIADEVQSGAGRTGTWWGHQQFDGADPDMVIFAKGIASGYPMAGVATKEHLFDNMQPGTMGGTYGGNAVACAAAVATIEAIEGEGMLGNAAARGVQLMRGLVALADKYPITDVRGRGLMVGAEFGSGASGAARLKAEKGLAGRITAAAFKRSKLLLMAAGARESIRVLPPLNVSEAEVDAALGGLEDAQRPQPPAATHATTHSTSRRSRPAGSGRRCRGSSAADAPPQQPVRAPASRSQRMGRNQRRGGGSSAGAAAAAAAGAAAAGASSAAANAAAGAANAAADPLPGLLAWFREAGVWLNPARVELRRGVPGVSGPGLGVFARADAGVPEGALLGFIPRAAILSPRTAALARVLEAERLGGGLALAVAVMHEASLGAESKWAGYLASLPPREYLPLFWAPDELALLQGTALEGAADEDRRDTADDYDTHVAPLLVRHPHAFPHPERCGLEQFRVATSWVASRSFHVDAWHGDAMLPLADIFNHKASLVLLEDGWEVAEDADAAAAGGGRRRRGPRGGAALQQQQAPGQGESAAKPEGSEPEGSGDDDGSGDEGSGDDGSSSSSGSEAGEGEAGSEGADEDEEEEEGSEDPQHGFAVGGMPIIAAAPAAAHGGGGGIVQRAAGSWVRDGVNLRLEIGICSLGDPDARLAPGPAPAGAAAAEAEEDAAGGADAGEQPHAHAGGGDCGGCASGACGKRKAGEQQLGGGGKKARQEQGQEQGQGQEQEQEQQEQEQQEQPEFPAERLDIIAASPIAPGAEVHNTYGELSNSQLVHKYGFCLPANPFDEVQLGPSWGWLLGEVERDAGLARKLAPHVRWLRKHSNLLVPAAGGADGAADEDEDEGEDEDEEPADPPAVAPGGRLPAEVAAAVRLLGASAAQLKRWTSLEDALEGADGAASSGSGEAPALAQHFNDLAIAAAPRAWWGAAGLELLRAGVAARLARYPGGPSVESDERALRQLREPGGGGGGGGGEHAAAVAAALQLRVCEQRILQQALDAVEQVLAAA